MQKAGLLFILLPNDKIFDPFVDNTKDIIQVITYVFDMQEMIVEKGENAGYKILIWLKNWNLFWEGQ